MNERIKMLIEQATTRIDPIAHDGECWDFDKEKFAQLIVQECLDQVDKVDDMLEDDKEKTGVAWVGLAIAKHFGVEK